LTKKKLFEGRATTQTKNAKFVSFQKMVDKKKLFETKNAKFVSFQKMRSIFCFKKLFFVNHFLKRYKV